MKGGKLCAEEVIPQMSKKRSGASAPDFLCYAGLP